VAREASSRWLKILFGRWIGLKVSKAMATLLHILLHAEAAKIADVATTHVTWQLKRLQLQVARNSNQ